MIAWIVSERGFRTAERIILTGAIAITVAFACGWPS